MNDVLNAILLHRADVTVPLGLFLAALVTLHVLLRKREVASAVGWIGLAWFAPITGSIAYFVLGVNRVQRRARRLKQGVRRLDSVQDDEGLTALQTGIGRITGRALVDGNGVAVFQNGDAAYPEMLHAIGQARASVGLSSYIFHDDVWGGRFIDALAAAMGRGVAVRVLIDGVGGGWVGSRAYHHLCRAGVPAARFLHSPLPWRMPFLNLRSHRKILVVDGATGFTGGMNVGDENVMAGRPPHPVQDTHFRLEGPVVGQLADAFAQDWFFAGNETLEGDAWFPAGAPVAGGVAARVIDSGPDEDVEKVEFAILQAVSCARKSIAIMTPYFLPDERLVAALSLAAMRGVSVDVVIPQISDHRAVDWALRANVGPLLADGVRIWRCPPPFRHSKLMVMDGQWCLIGSCNWDIRSFRLNFELCVEAYDRALSEQMTEFMVSCRGDRLTGEALETRSLVGKIRDSAARLMLPYL